MKLVVFYVLVTLTADVGGRLVLAQEPRTAVDSIPILMQQAIAALQQNTPESLKRALDTWLISVTLERRAANRPGEAWALWGTATTLLRLEHPDSALTYYRQALGIEEEIGDSARAVFTLMGIALAFTKLWQPDSALAYYRRTQAIAGEVGNRAGEGTALRYIGQVFSNLGRPDSALVYYRQAMTILRAVGDRPGEGATLNNLGFAFANLGRPDSALLYCRQALTIQRAVGDRGGEGATLGNIAGVFSSVGRPDSALGYYRQALAIVREVQNRADEGTALGNMGLVFTNLGRPDSALAYYRQALPIVREVRNRVGEGMIFGNIGQVFTNLGRPDSALVYHRRALSLLRDAQNRGGEGKALSNIAGVFAVLGQPDSALAYYRQVLMMMREVRDRPGEGVLLNNIAWVFSSFGRWDSAYAYYHQALAIARDVRNRPGEATTLNNIGLTQNGLGRPDSAFAYYRQAISIFREVRDRAGEGLALSYLGLAFGALGQPDSALDYLRQALTIQREVGDRSGEAGTLVVLGVVFNTVGQLDSALFYLRHGLTISRDVASPQGEGTALAGIGWVLARLGESELRSAVAYFDSGATVLAGVRRRAGEDVNRVSFAEGQVPLFDAWALAWLNRAPDVGTRSAALAALGAAERGRAQALLDLVRGARTDLRPGVDLATEGARLLAAATGPEGGVLYYLVTNDTLLIWLREPTGDVAVTRVPVRSDSLAALVSDWRAALGADEAASRGRLLSSRGGPPLEAPLRGKNYGESRVRTRAAAVLANVLGKLLLPPEFAQQMASRRELLIVPQGPLALVPFGALPMDTVGGLLGERLALRYAPSLASLRQAQQRPRPSTSRAELHKALVVGNPSMPTVTDAEGRPERLDSLPGSAAEGRWVAAYLGAPFWTGAAASEVAVESQLSGAPLVHLATHGFAYSSEALARQSFVALAPGGGEDGLLTVGELLDNQSLSVPAELVVLSACQTGLGNLREAEGTVGLQRAFLAKGAGTVLVSLWSVSDEATEELMKAFYTHWLADLDHPSKAEALRRAQVDLVHGSRFKNPLYWAAFQLVGAR